MSYSGDYGRRSGSRNRRSSFLDGEYNNDADILDDGYRPSSRSRPPSRSRRLSMSLAYTGASSLLPDAATEYSDDPLIPLPASGISDARSLSSRYPPSASRSSTLFGARDRSSRTSSISLHDSQGVEDVFSIDDIDATGVTPPPYLPRSKSRSRSRQRTSPPLAPRDDSPFKSKFFGSQNSASSGSWDYASGSPADYPVITDRRASRSSGRSSERSKGISFFERGDDEDDLGLSSVPILSESRRRARERRGPPQIHQTSFHSGFSDQMEYDKNGQEQFREGEEIHTHYSKYKADNKLAHDAAIAYGARKHDFPQRKRSLYGPNAALGDDQNRYGLGGNFTIPEHRELRHLAHRAFAHRRDETLGRESFNNKYKSVWEKRALTTGDDSVQNHKDTASDMRTNADSWHDTREMHALAMYDLGVPEEDITPMSSWGSNHGGRGSSRRSRHGSSSGSLGST